MAAHEQVGAAQGFWHWGQEASSPRARSASARKLEAVYLLAFPGQRKRGFGLGQPGSRSLELAGGGRERTFPLACALLLGRIEAPLEERDERRRQAQAAFASADASACLSESGTLA